MKEISSEVSLPHFIEQYKNRVPPIFDDLGAMLWMLPQ